MRGMGGVLILALCACSAVDDRDGIVLLDAAARESGQVLEVAGVDRTSPLPVAIRAGEVVEIYGTDGVQRYELFAGEVVQVGANRIAFGFLDEEVSPHAVQVDADESALEDLAYLSGAEPDFDDPSVLVGDDVLVALAHLDSPDGVREVHTVQAQASTLESVTTLGVLRTTGVGRSHSTSVVHTVTLHLPDEPITNEPAPEPRPGKLAPDSVATGLYRNPLHVGVYTGGDSCIILDAGGDAQVCGDSSKRPWTSDGDKVVLHELTGPVVLTMHDGGERVEFPGGRTMVRLGGK